MFGAGPEESGSADRRYCGNAEIGAMSVPRPRGLGKGVDIDSECEVQKYAATVL
jgi:hypothetical protein